MESAKALSAPSLPSPHMSGPLGTTHLDTMPRRWSSQGQLAHISNHRVSYPTPVNISYYWSFGSLSGMMLGVQLVTGIFLAMHYTPHVDLAFQSVEHIMRDVNYGWRLRYLHANGAAFFFIVVYAHILRNLYYGSYVRPRDILWATGIILFFLMMGTGFMGYVLPFGQMSLWAATVITNLASSVPLVGESVVYWLWGGFSVDNATLNRFFSIHFTLPFILSGLAILHLLRLHEEGSNNPLGVDSRSLRAGFYPYFYVKDLFSLIVLRVPFTWFVFFAPNVLGHTDNYIMGNPRVTPPHIVPEWYFLPYYAILRSIPHKLGGVVAMVVSILGFLALPYLHTSYVRSGTFRPLYRTVYWFFVVDVFLLGWIGQKYVEYPYVEIGQVGTRYYFAFMFVLVPLVGMIENALVDYKA